MADGGRTVLYGDFPPYGTLSPDAEAVKKFQGKDRWSVPTITFHEFFFLSIVLKTSLLCLSFYLMICNKKF